VLLLLLFHFLLLLLLLSRFYCGVRAMTPPQLLDPSEHRYVNGNSEALRRIKTKEFAAAWKVRSYWALKRHLIMFVGGLRYHQHGRFHTARAREPVPVACRSHPPRRHQVQGRSAEARTVQRNSAQGDESSEIANGPVLSRACAQLGIAEDATELGLTTLVTVTRGEEIIRNYKVFRTTVFCPFSLPLRIHCFD
jgi:hypothetical protein